MSRFWQPGDRFRVTYQVQAFNLGLAGLKRVYIERGFPSYYYRVDDVHTDLHFPEMELEGDPNGELYRFDWYAREGMPDLHIDPVTFGVVTGEIVNMHPWVPDESARNNYTTLAPDRRVGILQNGSRLNHNQFEDLSGLGGRLHPQPTVPLVVVYSDVERIT